MILNEQPLDSEILMIGSAYVIYSDDEQIVHNSYKLPEQENFTSF